MFPSDDGEGERARAGELRSQWAQLGITPLPASGVSFALVGDDPS